MPHQDQGQYPPSWAVRLLRFILKHEFSEEVEGDMEERFVDNLADFSYGKARWLYIRDVVGMLRPVLLKRLFSQNKTNYGMWKNNIKVAWRQMRKHRVFTTIKLGGFSVGIAACLLIALYAQHQLTYDQHYADQDRIFRLVNQWSENGETGYWANVHGPLKEVLEDNIPDMESVARVVLWPWGDGGENQIRRVEEDFNHYEEGFFYADPELLEVLEVPLLSGSVSTALRSPNTMVISRSKADQYFPNEDPIGKQMRLNDNPETTYTIDGVMEDFPDNSHLQGDFILTLAERKWGPGTTGWCCTNYHMYVKLRPLADKRIVEQATGAMRNSLIIDKLRNAGQSGLEEMQQYQSYYLQPVANIYKDLEEVGDGLPHGSLELTRLFIVIAIIIVVLACVNFIQLSTASSLQRAREVGLRKVVGSSNTGLMMQFLTEACLLSIGATTTGLVLTLLALPFFNDLTQLTLVLPWATWWFLPTMGLGAIAIGLLAGIYPAYHLTRYRPVDVLKSRSSGRTEATAMRNGLVVFQFAATVVLIISAIVVHRQFEFFMNVSLGYDKEQVINIVGLETMDKSRRLSFKEELLKLSAVRDASFSNFLPVEDAAVQNRSFWVTSRRQIDNGVEAAHWTVDEDYIKTMGMKMVSGREFDKGMDNGDAIIINQRMADVLRLDEPIGTQLTDMFDEKSRVIGVVQDFNFESLEWEVRPLVMVFGPTAATLSVKLATEDVSASIAMISAVWDQFNGRQSLRMHFMDQRFAAMYDSISRMRTVLMIFAFLSVLIACLGLFALSVFMIEQRAKEMSVRKVLGAGVVKIFALLTFDFVKLVFIAIVIALPAAQLVMEELLHDFAYRIDLDWLIFFIGGLIAVLIAFVTISVESLKAATANPIQRLRSE